MSTYAETFGAYRAAGWDGTLPLRPGTKYPPPEGYTGYTGRYPSGADCTEWAEQTPRYTGTSQLAIRPPDGVVGIDVDNYADKTGAATMTEAERRWGPLPDGPWSGSRDDGSGIVWFRVPEGTILRTTLAFPDRGLAGVELIQWFHRYAVVWPSLHPDTGGRYAWHGTDGGPDRPPKLADLPELPARWLEGLAADAAEAVAVGLPGVRAFLDGLPVGEPCPAVVARLDEALSALDAPGATRHDTARDHVLALLRLGEQGHCGALVAVERLAARFHDRATGDGSRSTGEADAEFARMVLGERGIGLILASPTADDDRGCCPGASPVARQRRSPGGDGEAPADRAGRRLRVVRASEVTMKVARWLWRDEAGYGRIPSGEVTVAGGRGNVGKSPFALWLAAQLTRGTLPGEHFGQPRDVVIYASEDSLEATVVPRLTAAGADLDRVHLLIGTETDEDSEMPLDWVADLPAIRELIVASAAALAVLDPLADVYSAGANTDKKDDVRRGIRPLVGLAHKTGVTVLGVAHFNKMRSGDVAALFSGSHALRDTVRATLAFATDTDGTRMLGQDKNNLGRSGESVPVLTFDMDSVDVEIADEAVSHPAFRITGTTDAVLADVLGGRSDTDSGELPDDIAWLLEFVAACHPRPAAAASCATEAESRGQKWDTVSRKARRTGLFTSRQQVGSRAVWVWELSEAGRRKAGKAPEPRARGEGGGDDDG